MEEWEEVANNRTNNFAVSVFILFYKLNLVKEWLIVLMNMFL